MFLGQGRRVECGLIPRSVARRQGLFSWSRGSSEVECSLFWGLRSHLDLEENESHFSYPGV